MVLAAKQKHPPQTPHHKRRHGSHQKRSKGFMNTYWPYLPMILMVAIGLLANNLLQSSSKNVLGYATDISVGSLLGDTNQNRQVSGQKSLKLNTALTAAAQAKAASMASLNYWSHVTPSGTPPWVFIKNAGYNYESAGENLAYGFGSAEATLSAWMQSPEHRANILNANFRDVGFGIANSPNYLGDGPETIIVAEYGQPFTVTAAAANLPGSSNSAPKSNSQIKYFKPAAQHFSDLQLKLGNNTALFLAVSVLFSLAVVIFCTKHWWHWRKALVKSEAFAISHPWLDIALVAVVTAGVVLSQTAGFIR